MSNALSNSVTRYRESSRVIAPAYALASASASGKAPDQEKPLIKRVLDDQEWEYLLTERVGIVSDSQNLTVAASAAALADTIDNYGPRPGKGAR